MARHWTCGGCKGRWPRTKQRCPTCHRKRPAVRKPAHAVALDMPYEQWVEAFGDRCGICGREASGVRRLDRDHDHKTGRPRGLLCFRCNRALPTWMDAEWLEAAAVYLRRGLAGSE